MGLCLRPQECHKKLGEEWIKAVDTFIDNGRIITYYHDGGLDDDYYNLSYVVTGSTIMVMANGDEFFNFSYDGVTIDGYHRIIVYDPNDTTNPVVQEERFLQEIKNAVNVNIILIKEKEVQGWDVSIESALDSKFPGKDIKFGMSEDIVTEYEEFGYYDIRVDKKYVTDSIAYAKKNGSVYEMGLVSPYYWGMYGSYRGKVECLDRVSQYKLDQAYSFVDNMLSIKRLIKNGQAMEQEIRYYKSIPKRVAELFDNIYTVGLYDYCNSIVRVWVELDGKKYVLKEQKGPVRVVTFDDDPNFYKEWMKRILEDDDF